eukprot:symbB.v1.2.005857.t3/scaffold335.1/size242651/8
MDYAGETSPVRKVIQLMQNMVSQGEKEMQDEKVQFGTYSQWCAMTKDKKTQAIADAADAIESMQADADKVTANIEKLLSEISGHQKEVEALALEQDNITQFHDQHLRELIVTHAKKKVESESVKVMDAGTSASKDPDIIPDKDFLVCCFQEVWSFPRGPLMSYTSKLDPSRVTPFWEKFVLSLGILCRPLSCIIWDTAQKLFASQVEQRIDYKVVVGKGGMSLPCNALVDSGLCILSTREPCERGFVAYKNYPGGLHEERLANKGIDTDCSSIAVQALRAAFCLKSPNLQMYVCGDFNLDPAREQEKFFKTWYEELDLELLTSGSATCGWRALDHIFAWKSEKSDGTHQQENSVVTCSGPVMPWGSAQDPVIQYGLSDHCWQGIVRSKESADYKIAKKDYVESIDALARAVTTLKKQAYDRKQAAAGDDSALLEMPSELEGVSGRHSKEVKEAISSFLQSSKKPEVAGYEFQSEGVVTMLSDLQDKFVLEKADLDKAEFEKKSAYELTLASLKSEADSEQKALDKKTALKGKKLQQKAQLEGNLDTTKTTKAADETYLKDTTATCDQKASDFGERQKLRVEELEAVNKAIDVMSSSSVSGNEKKHLAKSFVQVSRSTSLASLRSNGKLNKDVQDKVVSFLQNEADRLQSTVLAKLVAPTAASAAMVSIKDMLQSLLNKLQTEATDEQTKKDHCNKEIKTNKAKRAEKTAAVDELQADIDMLEASVKQLNEEAAALGDDITSLDQSVANATDIRDKEKAKNNETAAQAAVAQAISVLKEFYEKAGQATALVQTNSQSDQPAIFDEPYKGMGGESGGVLGLLEAIAGDFAKLESETALEEEAGASSFDSFMKESRFNKKQMEVDMKHKKELQVETATEQAADIQDKSSELTEVQKEMRYLISGTFTKTIHNELDASLKVWETLQDECLNTGKSYEEQKQQREETIESLQKALDMLSL